MAVRRESVELSVTGNFAGEMVRNAAAVALVRRELDQLNGHPFFQANSNGNIVQINRNAQQASQSLSGLQQQSTVTNRNLNQTGQSINQLTGRLGLFADAALILGPGLVPIAAVGATAIGGLAIATTAAVAAGGAAVIAFQGVGDAVKAANEYGLDPSAKNLEKLQVAMKAIGPDAQRFVRHFQEFRPVLADLRDSAAAGLFPGLTESLDHFERMGPRLAEILNLVGGELGDIVADGAESLSGERWVGFLGYLRDELPDALRSVTTIMGDFAHGAATLMQRLDPGNDSFLGWLEDVADGFDRWATSAGGRDDIRAFLEYARESGPEVAQLFTSLVKALAAIVTAAAPLGGPVLQGLSAVADMIAAIASSDAASPLLAAVLAFRLYTRGAQLAAAAQSRLNATQRLGVAGGTSALANARAVNNAGLTGTALGAALVAPRARDAAAAARAQRMARLGVGAQGAAMGGMVALSATGLGDLTEQAGASNTAMLTLLGTMIAPGWGTAAGAITGSVLDMVSANNDLTDSLDAADRALAGKDLTASAQNLAKARSELAKYREEQDIGSSDLPSFGAGLQNIKDDFQVIFGGKSDGDKAEERIRQLEDLYRAQYRLSKLKPVSNYAGLNDLFGDLTGSITPTVDALQDFNAAMKSADALLGYRSNLSAYEEAWDGITESIKENGRTLDEQEPKGRANIAALDDLATVGKKFAESLTGSQRVTFLKRFRAELKDAGKEFDWSTARLSLSRYLEELGQLDRKTVKPKADLDDKQLDQKSRRAITRLERLGKKRASPFADLYTGQFDSALGRANSDLSAFNGKTATAYINVKVSAPKMSQIESRFGVGSADGSTVPKTGLGYADRHPYLLADGEEVISNRYGQADRHRSLLKAINAGHLANGGTARDMRAADNRRYQAHASRASAAGGAGRLQVALGDLAVTGTLDTPFGPAHVEGIARTAARDEFDADRRFEAAHA